jgi:hypothetical protein
LEDPHTNNGKDKNRERWKDDGKKIERKEGKS